MIWLSGREKGEGGGSRDASWRKLHMFADDNMLIEKYN